MGGGRRKKDGGVKEGWGDEGEVENRSRGMRSHRNVTSLSFPHSPLPSLHPPLSPSFSSTLLFLPIRSFPMVCRSGNKDLMGSSSGIPVLKMSAVRRRATSLEGEKKGKGGREEGSGNMDRGKKARGGREERGRKGRDKGRREKGRERSGRGDKGRGRREGEKGGGERGGGEGKGRKRRGRREGWKGEGEKGRGEKGRGEKGGGENGEGERGRGRMRERELASYTRQLLILA